MTRFQRVIDRAIRKVPGIYGALIGPINGFVHLDNEASLTNFLAYMKGRGIKIEMDGLKANLEEDKE